MKHRRSLIPRGIAVLAGTALALAMGGALAYADGGSLDLQVADRTGYATGTTNDGAVVEYIGDQNVSFGSSGTGTFGTFLQVQNTPSEKGYNTDGAKEFDTGSSPTFNHAILLSDIPIISIGGQPYWELWADINDSNGGEGAQISLNDLEIYFTSDKNLTGYPFGAAATQKYDFNGSILINDVNQGSGRGDLRYSIPVSGKGIPAECGYKSPSCTTYFVVYTQFGTTGGNFITDSGFEEWKVKTYPYVRVTKTAATTYTRTYPWTIAKTATPATWNLFTGETGTSQYAVTATKGAEVDSDWAVSGSISISNPGNDPAVVESVSDVVADVGAASVNCGVTFPHTLSKNQSLNCTYAMDLPNGSNRVNTATVELDYGGLFTGSAAVTFGAPTTTVNGTVNVTDTLATLGSTSATQTWTYTKDFTCDANEGTTNNTATIVETGQQASASVTVNCYEIAVTKTAATALTRTYNWTIDKSVIPATWQLFTGESGTSDYTVDVKKTGSTDSAWAASGTIRVNNPNPIAATINSVSDVIAGPVNASVSCGVTFPHVIPANDKLDCTYSASLPDGSTRLNTATAVRQNHNYSYLLVSSNGGTTSKSGTESVDFSSATVTPVNATINVNDSLQGALGSTSGNQTFTYSRTFTCDADKGTTNNTATITQTGQQSSAAVTVSCYEINVTKDATETYSRKYHWTIDKSSTDTASLTLKPGEVYADYPYSIKVDLANPAYTDSDWAVNGDIHVNNPGPIAATINSVSDVLATDGAVTVDCGSAIFPYTLAKESSLHCTYSKSLTGPTDQLNTATAVRQNHNYTSAGVASSAGTTASISGTADVDFNGPSTRIDETINVVDDNATPGDTSDDHNFGSVSYNDELPKTFTYKRTFGPYTTDACGEVKIKNTATFTANDTPATGSDDWTVTITIPCPTGCTLTQGYWKTHSEFGPAPEDMDWYNLGAQGPSTPFYLSNQTWYQVFWTAPKGDAYYNLAHQYMAAKLNILSPADAPQAVDDAIAFAETFFATATPGTKMSKTDRAAVIAAAGTLGAYNEGTTGPGHCSEDSAARSAS